MEKNTSSVFGSLQSDIQKASSKVIINENYIIQSVMQTTSTCRVYKGIDVTNHAFVIIYVKPYSTENSNIVSGSKEQLKHKLCPGVKWTGTQKIAKFLYQIEVHQKFGPSLEQILNIYKQRLSDATFYLLAYHLIKLIEKAAQTGYVCHDLGLQSIVLHQQPEKNELFLFNTLSAKKKNEECSPINTKYCSIGAHLGLKACFKDDLESVCYILIDLYSRGRFFDEARNKSFLEFKNQLKISDLPQLPNSFVDLFIYVRNLNHKDEVNYNQWKGAFKKRISKNILGRPYEWISGSKIRKERLDVDSVITESDNKTVFTQLDPNHRDKDVDFVDDMRFDDEEFNSDDETIGQKILKNTKQIGAFSIAKIHL